MIRFYLFVVVTAVLAACAPADEPVSEAPVPETESQDARPFVVTTRDGVRVYGDHFSTSAPASDRRGTIVLFHQGGANARGEYGPVIPKLLSAGFDIVASDQRRGGQLYGSWNRTVAEYTPTDSYCSAALDVDAVLGHVAAQDVPSPVILWGSSYSAALVVGAAARHPDLAMGVLAFSPASGDPMEGCQAADAFDQITVPLIVFRPEREAGIESVQAQMEAATSAGHAVFVARPGTHGSSMLVPERVEGGQVDSTWDRVWSFLDEVAGQ